MSTDELKTRTVCLKLAKNCSSLYLCKNLSSFKVIPKEGSITLKHPKELYNKVLTESFKQSDVVLKSQVASCQKEPENETVLQKFIRGFGCGETCGSLSSSSGECSFNTCCRSPLQRDKDQIQDTNIQRPYCKVEFISPLKVDGDRNVPGKVKQLKPLVVDFSQKKTTKEPVPPLKLFKASRISKGLNESFITPKVKLENYSPNKSSSTLPLIISPAESMKYHSSSSTLGSPNSYSSTKVEIDYSGSSFQDSPQIDLTDCDFPRPIKANISEVGSSVQPKLIFGNKTYSQLQEQLLDEYANPDKKQSQALVNILLEVIGRYGSDSLSPMVNPQILDMNGMAEVAMSSDMVDENQQSSKKKRKYTRRTPLTSVDTTMTNLTFDQSAYHS